MNQFGKSIIKKKNIYIWIILVAAVIRIYFIFASDYISPDGVQYLRLGYHLWHEFEYTSAGAMFPDIIQPPLFPFLSGLFSLALPLLIAGKLASLVAGILLIIVVHRFLARVGNAMLANIGAALTALHPGLIAVSAQAATESWYILFVTLMLYDGWFFLQKTELHHGLRTGFWIVLGFLTRPEMLVEGLFFLAAMVLVRFIGKNTLKKLRSFSVLLPTVLGVLLYAGFVSAQLGYFTISPKINFVRIQSKLAGIAKTENPERARLEPKTAAYRAFYRLAPDTMELMSTALLYKKPSAMNWLGEHRSKSKKISLFHLLKIVSLNAKNMLRKLATGMGLPVLYALLALIGLSMLLKKERKLAIYLLWMCMPLSMYLFVHVEDRFLLGSWPMLVGPAAFSLDWLHLKLKQHLSKNISTIALFVLVLILTSISYQKMYAGFQTTNQWQTLGAQIKNNVPQGKIVIAKQPQPVFFLDADYRALPFASVSKILVYSQAQKADFLLITEADLKLNPNLNKIFEQPMLFPLALRSQKTLAGETNWLFHIK